MHTRMRYPGWLALAGLLVGSAVMGSAPRGPTVPRHPSIPIEYLATAFSAVQVSPADWVAIGDRISIRVQPNGFDKDLIVVKVGNTQLSIADSSQTPSLGLGTLYVQATSRVTGPLTVTFYSGRDRRAFVGPEKTDTPVPNFRVLDPYQDFTPSAKVVKLTPDQNYHANMTVYEGATYAIDADIQQLAGSRIDAWGEAIPQFVDADPHRQYTYFKLNDGMKRVTITPKATIERGAARFSTILPQLTGHFTGTGPCTLQFTAHVIDDNHAPHARNVQFSAGTFNVVARTVYRIDNSKDIKDILKFSLHGQHGTCEGTSTGLAGDIAVGQIVKGGDLTYSIRSGPLGTQALWKSEVVYLNALWDVTKLQWSEHPVIAHSDVAVVSRDGKSKLPGSDVVYQPLQDGLYPFKFVGWTAVTDAMGNYDPRFPFMVPLSVLLSAGITLWNDQGVESRLDFVEVSGPPGHTWHDAFATGH